MSARGHPWVSQSLYPWIGVWGGGGIPRTSSSLGWPWWHNCTFPYTPLPPPLFPGPPLLPYIHPLGSIVVWLRFFFFLIFFVCGGSLSWYWEKQTNCFLPDLNLLTSLAWVHVGLPEGRLKKKNKDEDWDLSGTWRFHIFFSFYFKVGRKGKLEWTMRDLILVLKFPSLYVTS